MKFAVLPTPKKTAVFAEATAGAANKTPKKSAGESFEHVAPRYAFAEPYVSGCFREQSFLSPSYTLSQGPCCTLFT